MASPVESAEGSALRGFLAEEMGEELKVGREPAGEGNEDCKRRHYTRPNGEVYVGRSVPRNEAGVRDDVELFRALREVRIFPRLLSAPGTGKTSAIEASFGSELITVVCAEGTDEDTLVGGYRPRPDWEWVDGLVTKALREDRPLLLDEFAAAHPRVQSRLNGVFDGRLELVLSERDGEVVRAGRKFWAAVAYNPGPELQLSAAMESRFSLPIRYRTDYRVAREIGVPDRVVRLAKRLERMVGAGEASWSPQMRELVAFRRHAELLGERWAVGALVGAAPEGCEEEVAAACAEVFRDVPARPLEL
ncbi:MAG: AAA domain-containing protein [Solirubrobacterales bacterium]|nr:AAA domain-containing protein [Solirubrobacterales bacterium]